ncbi:nucleotidyltransferase domain-containing protein [Halocatena halophila]|uniref:nucleotidyltransferase domain-containing protein n=1 Tax=Halocatena halophila TaxID=2814576 RepID=UPI002ED6BEC0
MDYDDESLRTVIDQAISSATDPARPAFYAVSGSHLYGFPSDAGGDIDVRGFHITDGQAYWLLDEPTQQYVINQGETTDGFEEYAAVDLVSYELRKFGELLYQANYNVLELVCCAEPVLNTQPDDFEELRSLIETSLPLDVAHSYVGMARSNYNRYLDPDGRDPRPTAKKFLYVLRGLLGAQYVIERNSLEPDVRELGAWAGYDECIEALIETKRDEEFATVDDDLEARARTATAELFETTSPPERTEKSAYHDALNDWMLTVRS